MRISQLHHMISEVERESRQRANEKFKPTLRKLEKDKGKIANRLANLIVCCDKNTYGEIVIDADSQVGMLSEQFQSLNKQEHDIYGKIGDEAERVAQMLLKKKGIEISVKDNRNLIPELVEAFDLEEVNPNHMYDERGGLVAIQHS